MTIPVTREAIDRVMPLIERNLATNTWHALPPGVSMVDVINGTATIEEADRQGHKHKRHHNPEFEGKHPRQRGGRFQKKPRKLVTAKEVADWLSTDLNRRAAAWNRIVGRIHANNPRAAWNDAEAQVDRALIPAVLRRLNVWWGDSLHVIDGSDPSVIHALLDLSFFPPALVSRLKRAGFNGTYLGAHSLDQLDNNGDLANEPARGHGGELIRAVGGVYRPERRAATVSTTGTSGSFSTILHELGHAVGDLLGLDNAPELRAANARMYGKLEPYFQQDGPGGAAGSQEMLAESISDLLRDGPQQAAADWDPEYITWLAAQLGVPGP